MKSAFPPLDPTSAAATARGGFSWAAYFARSRIISPFKYAALSIATGDFALTRLLRLSLALRARSAVKCGFSGVGRSEAVAELPPNT